MKRSLAFVLAVLALAGCGSPGPARKRIAVVVKALDSEFWLAVKSGVEAAAREAPAYEVTIMAPPREIDIDQQVALLEDQLVRKVSALVVAPAGVAQVLPALQKAKSQGIPVLLVDTDAAWDAKDSFIGTDNRLGGKLAGEFLAKKLGGQGKVALIRGILGVDAHEARVAGFQDAMAAAPGIRIVADQPANSERALAMSVAENILAAQKDLNAIFATSDQMALGALEAVQARGLAGKVAVVAFDAGQEVTAHIQAGRVAAAVAQKPYEMGYQSVKAAITLLNGGQIAKRIDTGTELVTADERR
jgi:ribose transport system substrate-binding protein